MSVAIRPKIFSALTAFSLLIIFVLAGFFAQTPQPSQSASPEASPTPSSSTTPVRTPSPTPLPGAQNFHQWGSITVFNGLPSDSVRAIAQTPDGVMWFGTDNGLARFDGRRIQNFSTGDADSDRITAICSSGNGELWIGTRNGAFVFSDGRVKPINNTKGVEISTIFKDDAIYLGTAQGSVLIVRTNEDGTFAVEKLSGHDLNASDGTGTPINKLIRLNGDLVAATSGWGLQLVQNGAFAEFHTAALPIEVNGIMPGDNGELWIGTNAPRSTSGIYVTQKSAPKSYRVAAQSGNINVLEANDGGIWAGSERYGLFQFASSKLKKSYTFANTSGGLRSDTIFTLFTDREGVLWIGTNRGVSRFDRLGASQETVSDIPNSNFVRSLFVDSGRTYAGTNRGLFKKDAEKEWAEVPQFKNRVVYSIENDNAGNVLVGSSDGGYDLSGRKLFDGDIRGFAASNSHEYAAVFGRGVLEIPSRMVFPNESVTSVTRGSNDQVWIGTAGKGLYRFDGNNITNEASPDALKSGTIWKTIEGTDGMLFVAGQHGVFAVRDGQIEQIIAVEDVRDVYEADGHLWAATTTRGLLHARRDDRLGWLVTKIGFEQGLPSEKAFAILPTEKGLLIGTNRGVVTYKPGTITPTMIVTRVLSQRAHDLTELAGKIDLEYPQNSLLVEVAGQSSRTFPEEFQYAYVLTNGKGEEVDRRISNDAQYAPVDLAPGEYTIEAISFNRDLLASDPLFIRFSVAKAPFPWTASALSILLAFAVIGLIWAMLEHRRIQHRNRELAAARFDLANEAERERRRIARDLHDQTLADLRNLIMLTDKTAPENPEFRMEIEAVSGEIRRICEDLSPSVLENVGLVAALEFLLDNTIENRKFSADKDLEDKIDLPMNVQLQIYRIAQEVLTNIKKHSRADHVDMSVAVNDDRQLKLEIDDNGKSFYLDGNSKGRGIANIKARASLVNAKVSWKHLNGGGNRFVLNIEV